MGRLIRCITTDGCVTAMAVDTADIVNEAVRLHKTSAVISAALGRLLTAASMMGSSLKTDVGSITLRVSADGPAGSVVAVADCEGNVRGYAVNPVVEIPLKPNGKLDVSGAVGNMGNLFVNKDLGIRICYKTPEPSKLTVILDNRNNLPTLVDYPKFEDLDEVIVKELDETGAETGNTIDLMTKYLIRF